MTDPERLRLFIAASAPPAELAKAESVCDALRPRWPGARWSSADGRHITLKFLGWVDAPAVHGVEAACTEVAARHEPAAIALDGLGVFPGPRRARVLWVGVDDPAGLLVGLASALDRALEPLGWAPESRPFSPHLTLARFRAPVRLDPSELAGGERSRYRRWSLDRFGLYRSHLSPKGARYERLRAFVLGGEGRRPLVEGG